MSWKPSNPNCNGNRRDKVALRTSCNKNVKFKIVKTRTSCHVGCFWCSENLYGAAQNLRLGRRLDIAGLELVNNDSKCLDSFCVSTFTRLDQVMTLARKFFRCL